VVVVVLIGARWFSPLASSGKAGFSKPAVEAKTDIGGSFPGPHRAIDQE
jgi:hypothetical protein